MRVNRLEAKGKSDNEIAELCPDSVVDRRTHNGIRAIAREQLLEVLGGQGFGGVSVPAEIAARYTQFQPRKEFHKDFWWIDGKGRDSVDRNFARDPSSGTAHGGDRNGSLARPRR